MILELEVVSRASGREKSGWIELASDYDELVEFLESLGVEEGSDDYYINQVETNLNIRFRKHTDIFEINDAMKEVQHYISSKQLVIANMLLDNYLQGGVEGLQNLSEMFRKESFVVYCVNNFEEFGLEVAEIYMNDVMKVLDSPRAKFFDLAAFGEEELKTMHAFENFEEGIVVEVTE